MNTRNDIDFSLLNIEQWRLADGNFRSSIQSIDKCCLCLKSRKLFYCKNCVRNGDFVHSKHPADRFAEKKLSVITKQQHKDFLNAECEKLLQHVRHREDKVEEIRTRKEKIARLQALILETRERCSRRATWLEELKRFNKEGADNLRRNLECKKNVEDMIGNMNKRQPEIRKKLDEMGPCLKNLIKRRIDELVQYIFPINEIQSTKSSSLTSDSQEDIKNELAEATRTAYVRGRWVYTDSWGESQHSIVAPTLPDSGDYSPYIHWVSANKDNTLAMTSSSGVDHNAAFNICAALTYTTQLINLIAFYLDIRLPNALSYSEFCTTQLSERRFMNSVTRLNANILMLCLTHNVDPHLLHPAQTIRNLLLLLDESRSDLGRLETVDIASSCISYLEEQLAMQVRETTRRCSISEFEEEEREPTWADNIACHADEYDSDHLSTDWEAVPLVSCPEATPGSNLVKRPLNSQSNSSIGLVTSAATSLASIFRGWSAK